MCLCVYHLRVPRDETTDKRENIRSSKYMSWREKRKKHYEGRDMRAGERVKSKNIMQGRGATVPVTRK